MTNMNTVNMDLEEIVGECYYEFWASKKRFVVCKGSRASKKSKISALWHISHMMMHPFANTLVVRQTEDKLRESCYAELEWAIERFGAKDEWILRRNPMEMVYKRFNNRILFRGLQDPKQITSIAVPKGYICWVWVEEAEQIRNPATFDFLVESVGRAKLPDGMFYRFTIIFNPWRSRHWLNGRFFEGGSEIQEGERYHINKVTRDTLAMTTTYLCNEWIDKDYADMMLEMKDRDPDRYKVAGLGQWGNEFGNTIFKRVQRGTNETGWFINEDDEEFPHEWDESKFKVRVGLDFGYSVDPTAIIYLKINYPDRQIAVMHEHFEKEMTNENIFSYFFSVGWHKLIVVGDKQNDKDMYRLKQLGLTKIQASFGGKVEYGINLMHEFTISVHKNCADLIDEFENYAWQRDKDGNMINKPIDEFNHGMDAIRYALQNYEFDFRKYLLLGGKDNLIGTKADPATRKEFLEFHKNRI